MLYESEYQKEDGSRYLKELDGSKIKMEENNFNGCYITTLICSILGYTDHCYVLTEMRNFRNNIMQKEAIYFDILLEYDVIGPIIARSIYEDYEERENKDMWVRFYQLYLLKTADLISSKKYTEAVSKYEQMMNVLKNYFGIHDMDLTTYQKDYDMSKGGHGKLKIKKSIVSI